MHEGTVFTWVWSYNGKSRNSLSSLFFVYYSILDFRVCGVGGGVWDWDIYILSNKIGYLVGD